jgi:hypothetical protein
MTKSLDEQEVDCQVARSIFNDFFVHLAKEVAAENKRHADEITRLTNHMKVLHEKKMSISTDRQDLIDEALTFYGPCT